MRRSKRIVLSTFGSLGDIHPYMAIALELQARGHDPVIATSSLYREKIEGAGLSFAAMRPDLPPPREQDQEMMDRIMEPKSGPKYLMEELIFPYVREGYADLMQASEGADLLVTHPITFAGPLVARTTGIPWISTVLAPLSFFSAYDPPMPPFWPWLNKLRLLGPRFMKSFMDLVKRNYRAKPVDELRKELGIPDFGNPAFDGQHSPGLVLALFSKHFAGPQADWPRQTQITGFPFYDGQHENVMPPELFEFLNSGAAPIVFTLGSSAVWVARDFFHESIAAAKKLGHRRAVLLIGDERNRPQEPLPPEMIAVDYAPFESLLDRGCVIVHHGGVGTTSQGLRAGIPTLIVPFAFDQSDNAAHAARLGTSRTLYRSVYKAERVAKELDNLLSKPQYAVKAREVGACLRSENGAATASDLIEEFLSGWRRKKTATEDLTYASRN
ncbi:MAG: glycosyltransferase family 1 protein [Pyrinomonadaceae bacterium]|nr:glycosyltransferase family 1 protein [Pyrinomonadaceae bacterium]